MTRAMSPKCSGVWPAHPGGMSRVASGRIGDQRAAPEPGQRRCDSVRYGPCRNAKGLARSVRMRDLQGVIDCGKGEIPVGVGVRCRLKAGLLDRRRPRGKHPTLHHRAPDRDIADGIRFDGQRILRQNGHIRALSGLQCPDLVLKLERIGGLDRHPAQGILDAGPLIGVGNAARGGQPGYGTPHQEQRIGRRHRHVRMQRPPDPVARQIAKADHGVGALGTKPDFAILIGQSRHIIGIAADNRAEILDPRDLIGVADGEVDKNGAMAETRVAAHIRLERVEHAVHAGIAVTWIWI